MERGYEVYTVHSVNYCLLVKPTSAGSGKIEVQLQKSSQNKKWSSLGTKLEGHGELLDEKHRGES